MYEKKSVQYEKRPILEKFKLVKIEVLGNLLNLFFSKSCSLLEPFCGAHVFMHICKLWHTAQGCTIMVLIICLIDIIFVSTDSRGRKTFSLFNSPMNAENTHSHVRHEGIVTGIQNKFANRFTASSEFNFLQFNYRAAVFFY